ncbi:MAG: alpha/beta hydrolase [Pseudomonadota bacterium]
MPMLAENRRVKRWITIPLAVILITLFILIAYRSFDYETSHMPSADLKAPANCAIQTERWHMKKRFKTLKGVALVIHGLNLKPEKMEALIVDMNQAGIDVLNLSLHGHGSNYACRNRTNPDAQRLESFMTVTYALWSKEVHQAYQTVRKRADRKDVSVFLIGYSLGGLLGCDLLTSRSDVSFDRMVLFAPALNVMIESYLLKALSPFPNLVIDSLSPKSYRSNDGTPMAAYKALFEAIDHFEGHISDKLNVPTVIFIDEKDEFISYRKLQDVIDQKKLDRWSIHKVQKDEDVDKGMAHHLVIDKPSTGSNMWGQVRSVMRKHLLS